MRFLVPLLSASLLVVGLVVADDKPAERPKRPEVIAADAVLEALRRHDDEAGKALGAKDRPDPWLVVDELCSRGEHDAAAAFAKASPRPDVAALPAYVEEWRKRPLDEDDAARRTLFLELDAAAAAGQYQKVVDGTEPYRTADRTVLTLRLLALRSEAIEPPDAAEEVMARTAQAAYDLGWLRQAGRLYKPAARSAQARFAWEPALLLWGRYLAVCERREDAAGAALANNQLGLVRQSRGEFDAALKSYGEALARWGADKAGEADSLANIGRIHAARGDYDAAIGIYQRVLPLLAELGKANTNAGAWARGAAATTHGLLGNIELSRGDYNEALASYGDALAEFTELDDERRQGEMLNNIGRVFEAQGNYNAAKTKYLKSIEAKRRIVGAADLTAAGMLRNEGSLALMRGVYAEALTKFRQARQRMESLGLAPEVAEMLGKIGDVHEALGDHVGALKAYDAALKRMETLGLKPGIATTLANIGSVHQLDGDHALALGYYRNALEKFQAMKAKPGVAATLGNIGVAQDSLKQYDEALATYEDALRKYGDLGNQAGVAMTLGNIGEVHQHLGRLDDARSKLEKSVGKATSLEATPQLVAALTMLARLHLEGAGRSPKLSVELALANAQRAQRESETLLQGLGDEHGATARGQLSVLLAVGTLASARLERSADACAFLESGRAGALLDMLGGSEALHVKSVGDLEDRTLEREYESAKTAEREARRAYDLAVGRHDALDAIRAAQKALVEAGDAVRTAGSAIESKRKTDADLATFRARTIEDIEASLGPREALVLYGLFHDEKGLDAALALVLRRDGDRIVPLGRATEIEAACKVLTGGDSPLAGAALSTRGRDRGTVVASGTDWDVAVRKMRELLVDPLKLESDVTRVLVSPDGPLCYVPFGALFEPPVAMTPSGTTHVVLRAQMVKKGAGILALGDPDYAGRSEGAQTIYYGGSPLASLPATRREVEAIGTKSLLGKDASESGLRAALPASKRWRAVHFACHGLVDVERPMLSSLALSRSERDESDDGFLTALDIMRTEMPADLVVLSACDTSRGKIQKGEGIMGFTRAFMFAGAQRVICSLWAVPDDATAALMIRFYELWNPKDAKTALGAAEALKQAQAFVRDHPDHGEWKEPRCWAAWTLWGLPD